MAANERFFRSWEIKNAEGFTWLIAAHGCERRKHGVHGEAGADDFVFRDAP